MSLLRPVVALMAGVVSLGALAACSSSAAAKPRPAGRRTPRPRRKVANVTITAAGGCQLDTTRFAAGGVTFKIENKDATAVSEMELLAGERILGEKENIPPGLGGQFAVNLTAGTYTVYCPGANVEKSSITVTGKSATTGDDTLAALLKTRPTSTAATSTASSRIS